MISWVENSSEECSGTENSEQILNYAQSRIVVPRV